MGDNFEKLRFVFENDALRLKMREHFVLRIIRALLLYSIRAKHLFMIEKYYFFFWDLRLALCWRYFAF